VLGVTPDFVWRADGIALFVDGCFWHGCPIHRSRPMANKKYWSRKYRTNKARDRRNNRELIDAGWIVVRTWECAVRYLPSALEQKMKAAQDWVVVAEVSPDMRGVVFQVEAVRR